MINYKCNVVHKLYRNNSDYSNISVKTNKLMTLYLSLSNYKGTYMIGYTG